MHLLHTVSDQFTKAWRHPTKPPQIRYIYKIVCAPVYTKRYMTYRQQVEMKIEYSYTMGGPGNQQRRFHGTKRACLVGDKGNTTLCTSDQCSLCRIIKISFDLRFYQNNTSWGR
jgi:hypothetical protein